MSEQRIIEPQILQKDGEPTFAVLPIAEWRRLMERLANLEDSRDLEMIAADPNSRMIPGEVMRRLLDDEHPLKAWREHRGLSRAELAAKAGLTPGHIGHIESGRRHGTSDALRRLATALDLTVDDLVPITPTEADEEAAAV